jgi:Tfp pilus assembly protein PilF
LAWLRKENYARAVADFDRAIELEPQMADAFVNRGLARLALKDPAGAEADLTRALQF